MGIIIGVDEVGLGALAGPLVVAAVQIVPGEVLGVRDSKTIKNRLKMHELANRVQKSAIQWNVCARSAEDINEIGIRECWREAVYSCCRRSSWNNPLEIWIDGSPDLLLKRRLQEGLNACIHFLIRGDSQVYAISAASIVAKDTRDTWMGKIHQDYPEYGFAKHVGYGTPQHIAAIKKYGLSPIHRTLFCRKWF